MIRHYEPLFIFAAHMPPRELRLLTLDQIQRAVTWWDKQKAHDHG